MKIVYIVKGSEDGNIGVFGSITKAFNRCEKYLNNSTDNPGAIITEDLSDDGFSLVHTSVKGQLKKLRARKISNVDFFVTGRENISAEIQAFFVE